MSSRRPPSGPQAFLSGFIAVPAVTLVSSSAQATVSAIARIFIGPAGTATANMNGRVMSTNDVVTLSPRVVPLSSVAGAQVTLSYARVMSVEASTVATALAWIQLGVQNSTNVVGDIPANTYDIAVTLRGADL
jgi:hypothetical protein